MDYSGISIDLSSKEPKILFKGEEDKSGRFVPSYVDNGEGKEPTIIGVTDTINNKFISLSGKVFNVTRPEDIKI